MLTHSVLIATLTLVGGQLWEDRVALPMRSFGECITCQERERERDKSISS